MERRACDALVFGGGFAGLWILERLVRAGYDAYLVESAALGRGQSVQAQGIIHGGGKYALRGVRDFSAAAAIREMPATWRACLEGRGDPDLSAAQLLSDRCHLWVPRAGWISRLSAWGLMPVVQKAGLLHAKPERLPPGAWPDALQGSARAVYAMPEPVVSTGSTLAALAAGHRGRILVTSGEIGFETHSKRGDQAVVTKMNTSEGSALTFEARSVLLAAGAGNEGLLEQMGLRGAPMQRRPLLMALLRGRLPRLFAHCVAGGKTAMTVTSHPWDRDGKLEGADEIVWQVGGEVAERFAGREYSDEFRAAVERALDRMLPALPREGLRLAAYVAVRAEAESARHRRPSGVHAQWVTDKVMVTWPTKMALTPLLADEVVQELAQRVGAPGRTGPPPDRPVPAVAPDPWREEGLEWHSLS